jgi:hypothetical protein
VGTLQRRSADDRRATAGHGRHVRGTVPDGTSEIAIPQESGEARASTVIGAARARPALRARASATAAATLRPSGCRGRRG